MFSHLEDAQLSRWAFFISSLVFLVAFGCEGAPRAERLELSEINRAVDALRKAENAAKAPLLKRLRAVPCDKHCTLRDKCIDAYDAHVQALSLIEEAGARGEDEAAGRLDEAERRLKQALVQVQACTSLQAELSR